MKKVLNVILAFANKFNPAKIMDEVKIPPKQVNYSDKLISPKTSDNMMLMFAVIMIIVIFLFKKALKREKK